MKQKEKSGSELKISFYINLILISLSGLLGHNLETWCLKSQDNKTQDKIIGQMLFIPTNPHPTIHMLKLTKQQVLILPTALISPNDCLKIPLAGRKSLSYLVPPQSICGLKSLALPLILIQPFSQSKSLYITSSLCLLHCVFPIFRYNIICIIFVATQKATLRTQFGFSWPLFNEKHNQILSSRDNICFYKQYFHLIIAALIRVFLLSSDQNLV